MAGSGLDLGQTPKGSGLPHFHPGWHQTDKEMPAGEETEGFPGKLGIAMQSVSSSDSTAGQKKPSELLADTHLVHEQDRHGAAVSLSFLLHQGGKEGWPGSHGRQPVPEMGTTET